MNPIEKLPTQVDVALDERSYPIVIDADWLDRIGAALAPYFPPRPCTLVTNPTVGRHHAEGVRRALAEAGYRVSICEIPDGEEHKNVASLTRIWDHMLRERHTRESGIVALGGGVVGDIAGFAAATLLRGIAFIQLPTTLLAMVDSSVGGKTGINHEAGKNLIGAFWQPVFVGIDLRMLETLPDEELRSGMAEVIKHGIIADRAMFEFLEQHIERALDRDPHVLAYLVRRSCEIKADVVARDEREEGLRAILNFGHTFGHAAEALSNYNQIRHGEGVAMGMVAAMRLAARRGVVGDEEARRVEQLCRRAGLPTRLLPFSAEQYWRLMGSDKKVRDGRVRFVLPTRLGHVEVYADVGRDEVEACLRECGAAG
ncbi:MAG TPA: 3-dehydroquinate synthase [Candidatus Sumerlaeota bacterium]|nr:3-dehydroquinate synthase [Candidatus Sumerlaeota bacterium]HOR28600.1 3-dehydroquinate synthase [Candidatus Sumerlaeota bacterium]HPK03779.1 3-dehydroquinate synthase [Candidatus Sumerlaeota bacterium]